LGTYLDAVAGIVGMVFIYNFPMDFKRLLESKMERLLKIN